MTSLIPAYDVGDKVRIGNDSGTNADGTSRQPITDGSGTPTDPTGVLILVLLPDGSQFQYGYPTGPNGNLVHESTGRFYVDLAITLPGRWRWEESATGGVMATSGPQEFIARQPI